MNGDDYNAGFNPGCTGYSQPIPDQVFSRGGGGGNNNRKRAAKRRVKHDLPGPVGVWFRQQKQKTAAKTAKKVKKEELTQQTNAQKSNDAGGDGGPKKALLTEDSSSSPDKNDDTEATPNKRREQQLFHDHSADLHECNAWNLMCMSLNRIVSPPNLLLSYQNASSAYKRLLRRNVSENYALIHEIHEGRYDVNHLSPDLYNSDLRIPMLVGYVASVQCHAHSDWTALLVDEMHSVATNNGGSSKNGSSKAGRGILCWIEERLVKQHAGWVRPGAVWMLEGAKLSLFLAAGDDDDDNEGGANQRGYGNVANAPPGMDVSPSTDTARGGGSIDRMILVGEASLVHAWTPEEASSSFTHNEFVDLTEKRISLGLPEEDVIEVEKGEDSGETIGERKLDYANLVNLVDDDTTKAKGLDRTIAEKIEATAPTRQLSASKESRPVTADANEEKLSENDAEQNTASKKNALVTEKPPPEEAEVEIVALQKSTLEVDSTQTNLTCQQTSQSRKIEDAQSGQNTDSQPKRQQQKDSNDGATVSTSNPKSGVSELLGSTSSNVPPPQMEKVKGADDIEQLHHTTKPASSDRPIGQEKENTAQPLSANTFSRPNPYEKQKNPQRDITSNKQKSGEESSEPAAASTKALSQKKDRARGRGSEAADDDRLGLLQFSAKKAMPTARKTAPKQAIQQANKSRSPPASKATSDQPIGNAGRDNPAPPAATTSQTRLIEPKDTTTARSNKSEEVTTPKVQNKPNPPPPIGTGDSFDDMLDEDEEDMFCDGAGVRNDNGAATLSTSIEESSITPPGREQKTPTITKTPNRATTTTKKGIFDSLDGDDDMDFLSEED